MKENLDTLSPQGKQRRRFLQWFAASIVGAGVVSCGQTNRTPGEESNSPASKPDRLPDINESFDLASFNPKEGQVIHRRIEAPDKKNIILLTDSHTLGVNGQLSEKGLVVQRELFEILKELIPQHSIHLVQENHVKGLTLERMRQQLRLMPKEETGMFRELQEMLECRNPQKLQELAERYIDTSALGAGQITPILYRDRCELVGVIDLQQVAAMSSANRDMEAIALIEQQPYTVPCHPFGVDNRELSVGEAKERFDKGDFSKEVVDCVCAVRAHANKALADYEQERYVTMPNLEAQASLDTPGKLTVIIAGIFHAQGLRQILDSADVNFAIISPHSIAKETTELMSTIPDLGRLPDDEKGTCREWEEGAEDRFVQWFMED